MSWYPEYIKGLEAEAQSHKQKRLSIVVEGNSVLKSGVQKLQQRFIMVFFCFFPNLGTGLYKEQVQTLEPSSMTACHLTQLNAKFETSFATHQKKKS